ncbi:IS30 family transposase [Candidatus Spongiihabitans sp.]|uniref:IS30 family transposase n=1 Tax=Candidatus Spongiihabitans sp. TaxID=3101308 RepID=UPI003C6F73ED
MRYTQLTQEERYQIYAFKQTGYSQTEVAAIVGRDKGTISRGLRRNQGLKGYRLRQAHQLAQSRRKRYGATDRRGVIPGRTSIDEHPAMVDARCRIGDWEGDTMIGKGHRSALVTLVKRKSRHTIIRAVLRKTAEAVRNAVTVGLAPHINQVHAITYDNGREFSCHASMARDLEARIYFAHPYASWQRGLNENTNGLIRQYFPKQRELTTVCNAEIKHARDKLNHRPRKTLGFRTPH